MPKPYRILVTGSREFDDVGAIEDSLWEALRDIGFLEPIGEHTPVLVHGQCPSGADHLASSIWRSAGLTDEPHPADWSQGKKGGPLRNKEMVDAGADVCLAFFKRGAKNVGTTGCVKLAREAGIDVREVWR